MHLLLSLLQVQRHDDELLPVEVVIQARNELGQRLVAALLDLALQADEVGVVGLQDVELGRELCGHKADRGEDKGQCARMLCAQLCALRNLAGCDEASVIVIGPRNVQLGRALCASKGRRRRKVCARANRMLGVRGGQGEGECQCIKCSSLHGWGYWPIRTGRQAGSEAPEEGLQSRLSIKADQGSAKSLRTAAAQG